MMILIIDSSSERERLPTNPTIIFVLKRVWFLIIKYFNFEAYPLLAPKCRVGADRVSAVQVTHTADITKQSMYFFVKYM